MLAKIEKNNPVYIGKIKAIPEIENGVVIGIYDEMVDEDNPLAWEWKKENEEILNPTFNEMEEILESNEEVTINIGGYIFYCEGYAAPEKHPDGDIENWYNPELRYCVDYQTVTRKEFQNKLSQQSV